MTIEWRAINQDQELISRVLGVPDELRFMFMDTLCGYIEGNFDCASGGTGLRDAVEQAVLRVERWMDEDH